MGRKTWNLSRGGLTLSHSVLDHGLNLCQNIPLSPQVLSNLLQALWIFDVFPDFPWAALCAVSVLGPFDLQIKHFSQAYNANVICHVWCKCQPWMYPGVCRNINCEHRILDLGWKFMSHYVSKFKEFSLNSWCHAGHEEQPPDWKSCACLTHPSIPSFSILIQLLLTSSFQL